MPRKNIIDLVEGDELDEVFLLASHQIRLTKSNSQYLSVSVSDKTGTISGNVWDIPENVADLKDGEFVSVNAAVTKYLDQLQLKFISLDPLKTDEVKAEDRIALVPSIEQDPEVLYQALMNDINNVEDPQLKQMSVYLLDAVKSSFTSIPAAKTLHHAELGGLLLHSYEVIQYIKAIHGVTPWFDCDLAIVGGLFHDIGKLNEYIIAPTGLVSDYSREGMLLNHVYMGTEIIGKYCNHFKVSKEKTMRLQHMILSHHGEFEYGSPVKPSTMEAYVLHMADELSAKMHMYKDAVESVNPGEFSEKVYALDGLKVYRPEN